MKQKARIFPHKDMPKLGYISMTTILCLFLFVSLFISNSQTKADPCIDEDGAITCIFEISLSNEAIQLNKPTALEDASDPTNPYALIRKQGPHIAGSGNVIGYQINLANYDAITRTVQLVETLPTEIEVVPNSLTDGLSYNEVTRQLTWQGLIPPAHLVYQRLPDGMSLPYIDLAAYGVPNLCLTLPDCDETAVTFNLGINNRHFSYYGSLLSEISVSPNGLIIAGEPANTSQNLWLPHESQETAVLAGLWRDIDMRLSTPAEGEGEPETLTGRMHAALLTGLLPEHEVFYVQWHNAAAASDPDNTSRHAIALALGNGPYAGHVFYIYDNIAHPEQIIADGYTIGLSDLTGTRGLTVAFADCCNGQPPQGYPPATGTTWHLAPVLLHPENTDTTLSYQTVIHADVPETIATTVVAYTDSPHPDNQMIWATHYLFVRELTYLPVIQQGDGS